MSSRERIPDVAAAPLRTKIAQFESKGGVPLPRGGASFGIGAPPPKQQQGRGELYGNRMKPVWVPSAGPPSLAKRTRDERREARRAQTDISGERTMTEMVDHLPSPPESPPGSDHLPSPPESPLAGSASSPPSPASSVQYDSDLPAEQEHYLPKPLSMEFIYEIPEIIVSEEVSDEEDVDEDVVDTTHEGSVESPLPSPPPAVPVKTEERSPQAVVQRTPSPPLPPSPPPPASPPSAMQRTSSPPLPPSPPLSPESPMSDDMDDATLEVRTDSQYGTILISPPPPRIMSSSNSSSNSHQGQSFSSVVHGRVREPTPRSKREHEKRLPPPPPSPGYTSSISDLTALVENAAALERRLVAGELPADFLKRLSALGAPPPVNKDAPITIVPPSRSSSKESAGTHGEGKAKHGHGFMRNPLGKRRSRKQLKEGLPDLPPAHAHEESTWFAEAATLSGWRKLASTARHKSPTISGIEGSMRAPRTLVSTP